MEEEEEVEEENLAWKCRLFITKASSIRGFVLHILMHDALQSKPSILLIRINPVSIYSYRRIQTKIVILGLTCVCLRDDRSPQRLTIWVRLTPRELEVIRVLFHASLYIHYICFNKYMLRIASVIAHHNGILKQRTTTAGNSSLLVCVTCAVRRRMEPMETGRSNQIPSSERKRRWRLRVKSEAVVKPSCQRKVRFGHLNRYVEIYLVS